jgi:hypothetical protein
MARRPGRQWSDLSDRTRMLLLTAAAADGILRVAALIDIKRRPAGQIRGRKWMWATAVTVISSAGVIPVSYFILGAGSGACPGRKGGVTHETDHRDRQA